jgi:hypothetical protein
MRPTAASNRPSITMSVVTLDEGHVAESRRRHAPRSRDVVGVAFDTHNVARRPDESRREHRDVANA